MSIIEHFSEMAPNGSHLSISRFEKAFKYSLKTQFIFKGSFFTLMRTSLPTAKKVPFLLF